MEPSSDALTQRKSEARKTVRSRLASIRDPEREAASFALTERVCELPAWLGAASILAFASMPEEVDTRFLIDRAEEREIPVYLPLIVDDRIDFHLAQTSDDLIPGQFDIREPAGTAPLLEHLGRDALILCPGLAFDEDGNRLGRGKAYYDRFLSPLDRATCTVVGICYDCQVLDSVPAGPTDQRVDFVVTETRTIIVH